VLHQIRLASGHRSEKRERHGKIPSGLHLPHHDLQENVSSNGVLPTLAATGKILLFYCAFGERLAMAVQAAQDAGLTSARHIEGGIDAWKKVDGVLDDGSGRPLHAPAGGI
jgi:sulfur dioxygenase